MTTQTASRRHRRLLYTGLVVTALVTVVPWADLATVDSITGHVRETYPSWPADWVAADRIAIAVYLSIVGVLGIAGWLWTIRMSTRRPKRTRAWATVLFGLGVLIALTNLSYGGEAYDTIIPTWYGALSLLPVLAGAAALVQLWRQPLPSTLPTD